MSKPLAQIKQRQSLTNFKNQYENQKAAISKALASDGSSAAQKRKFAYSDDENEDENVPLATTKQTNKKKQAKSQETAAHTSKRKIFSYSDDEAEAEQEQEQQQLAEVKPKKQAQSSNGTAENAGRKTNLFAQATPAQEPPVKKYKKMQRFDPDKDGDKFNKSKPADESLEAELEQQAVAHKERRNNEYYHKLSEALPNLLEANGNFSLLGLFDSAKAACKQDASIAMLPSTTTKGSKDDKLTADIFHFDAPEREEANNEELNDEPDDIIERLKQRSADGLKAHNVKRKKNIFVEAFFLAKNAPILKEGRQFFKSPENVTQPQDYEPVRAKLAGVIKTKIRKTQKHLKNKT